MVLLVALPVVPKVSSTKQHSPTSQKKKFAAQINFLVTTYFELVVWFGVRVRVRVIL